MESPRVGEELWTMFPNFWPAPEPTKKEKNNENISIHSKALVT